jgi:hypothetical protein
MAQKFTVPVTIKNLSSAGSDGLTVFLDQESFARLKVEAGGRITWGPGSGAGDTNLYRDEASVLKTDDTFKSAGLYVSGTQIDPTGAVVGDALVFNGTKFISASVAGGGGGNASLTISDTPPTGATEGDLWFESDTGKTFVYYDSFWIEVGSGGTTTDGTLSGLSDVVIASPANGEFLRYSSSASAWINDPVNLSTDTIGDYVQSLVAGTGVTVSNNSGEGTTPTVAIGQAVGTSSSVQFAAVTAPLIGNASTASSLQTARTISLSGDLSGSASFNGTSDIDISASVVNSGVSLDEISDVVITSPLEYESLVYNGTNWVNQYASNATYVRNAEATTLATGTVVYLFGATGDHATVKRADNDSDTTSSKTVGLVASPIAASENGPVVTRGYVDGIDLSTGYASGDVLWLGEDGAFTKTKPSAPEHLVFIGVVVRATNNGIVYVATQNGYELDELHDVSIVDKTSGDFLKYNGTLWVNDPINLGTDTVGNYMSDVSAGTGIAVSHTPGEGSTATVSIESTAWTSYTPTITADGGGFALNNGTLTGRYKQVGKTVFFKLKFVFGSTTAAGTGHWNFSLPVTAYDSNFTFSAAILDNGNSWYGGIGNGNYTGSTSNFAVIIPGTSSSVTTWASVGNGGPFIWGTDDNITITGSYEAA